jgi:alginate O-acetyltransferase complex protein AlgJ
MKPAKKYTLPFIFVWTAFSASLVPSVLLFTATTPTAKVTRNHILENLPIVGWFFTYAKNQYSKNVKPVIELRKLAPAPVGWKGRWFDVQDNYAQFEKWYCDHLGLRDLFIRTKNEIDYKLFRSSSRVYFGKHKSIMYRSIVDKELPATEKLLDTNEKRHAVLKGVIEYSQVLQSKGVIPIFMAPMQKTYFYEDILPFFAPRLPKNSHFMKLYDDLKNNNNIHFVDVFKILKSLKDKHPIFYRQDFHWTEIAGLAVAEETTNLIAGLEKSPVRWMYPIKVDYKPFIGGEARFAARLNSRDILEPRLIIDRKRLHAVNTPNTQESGMEFETILKNKNQALLPETCMYGNSFSDAMIVAGLVDYYKRFTRFDRHKSLSELPDLSNERCKYLIIQILDLQTAHWASFIHNR